MFTIGFLDVPLEYPFDDPSVPAAPGHLVLGGSEEEFLANLSIWGKSDYQRHWKRELEAIVEGSSKAALVVSFDDPKVASNLEIWRVYRDGEWAHFQNQLMPYENLAGDFQGWEMVRYIDDRAVRTADGDLISEWDVPIREIESFLY
jgi:hypothetical protein